MAQPNIKAEKITSPIQLMAAWFVMLILLSGVLLTAASQIKEPEWAAGYLVLFCSLVIIIVITCVTLMLTKFRPHLQESKEYAEWLKDQNAYSKGILPKIAHNTKRVVITDSTAESCEEVSEPSEVRISVLDAVGGINIVESLKNVGLNADIYESSRNSYELTRDNIRNNQGIWVGKRVPPEIVVKVISLAKEIWPDLQYINISGDHSDPPDYVHDQIFVGGSNSVVERYNLRRWSTSDFSILDGNISLKKFHTLLRKNYS